MFFKKPKQKVEEARLPEEKSESKKLKQRIYFNGLILLEELEGNISAQVTEEGIAELGKLSLDELIAYLGATLSIYVIDVDVNISGAGPMTSSRMFLAYHVLVRKLADLIRIRRDEEKSRTLFKSLN